MAAVCPSSVGSWMCGASLFLPLLSAATSRVVFRDPAPAISTLRTEASQVETLQFTVALKQRNMRKLKELALVVSSPGHAEYGRFISRATVDELTRPSAADVDVVVAWLRVHGVAFRLLTQALVLHLASRLFASCCA